MILGIIMLISLISLSLSNDKISLFLNHNWYDPILSATFGSLMAGNPVTSYVIGGELLKLNVTMVAIISFLVAWVSVGFIQLPAEMNLLGKKFALLRNLISFVFSICVAFVSVFVVNLLG